MTIEPKKSPRASATPNEPTLRAQVREERKRLLDRLQREAIAAAKAAGHTTSVVDELVADRRAEAARDRAEAPLP